MNPLVLTQMGGKAKELIVQMLIFVTKMTADVISSYIKIMSMMDLTHSRRSILFEF